LTNATEYVRTSRKPLRASDSTAELPERRAAQPLKLNRKRLNATPAAPMRCFSRPMVSAVTRFASEAQAVARCGQGKVRRPAPQRRAARPRATPSGHGAVSTVGPKLPFQV